MYEFGKVLPGSIGNDTLSFRPAVLIVFFVIVSGIARAQGSNTRTEPAKIGGSTILAELRDLKERDPTITPGQLAERGNRMIAEKGVTYVFEVGDFLAKNGRRTRQVETEFFQPYSIRLTTLTGQTREFEIAASAPFQGAGCFTKIAATRVTDTEMTVIADGKPVNLLRPKEFHLGKTELVDPSLKRVLRRWEVPFQRPPVGISPDGLKLHLEPGVDMDERKMYGSLDDLSLELSAAGEIGFRARENVRLTNEGPGRDAYVRFRRNGRTFIIRPHYDRNFLVLMATGMLIPPEPIYPIETRPFSQRNPTAYDFPGSVPEVRQRILAILKDFGLMEDFYRTFSSSGFSFSVEGREKNLFANDTKIFADEKNKDDLYLHSHGTVIGPSSLYSGGGIPLRYGAEFQLHFIAIDPNTTRVSVITHNPRVYNGTVCCGLHGYRSNMVSVEPSTIEEYKLLNFLGRRLGVEGMPPLRLPEGAK